MCFLFSPTSYSLLLVLALAAAGLGQGLPATTPEAVSVSAEEGVSSVSSARTFWCTRRFRQRANAFGQLQRGAAPESVAVNAKLQQVGRPPRISPPAYSNSGCPDRNASGARRTPNRVLPLSWNGKDAPPQRI
jgi:hypothetical protein